MTAQQIDINQWHNKLVNQTLNKELSGVIAQVRQRILESGLSQHLITIDDIRENYRLILGFFEKGTPDEQRLDLHHNTVRQVLALLDRLKEDILVRSSSDPISRAKSEWLAMRKPYGVEAAQWADGLAVDSILDKLLEDTLFTSTSQAEERRSWLQHLFNLAWLPDKLQDEEAIALTNAILNDQIPWYERAMLSSGISLGLLRSFDPARINALMKLVQSDHVEVRVRALSGLIFTLFLHHKRLPYYPKLKDFILTTFELSINPKEVEILLLQWLRSQDTEALGRTLREELLPGMMRITPLITERLKLDEILPVDQDSDKNPDWESVFQEDPELLDKLQRFTERHLAGDDVFMSVFSQQKHYPFFKLIAHWFLPFHLDEPIVASILATNAEDSGINRLIRDMASTHLLSHSDKYSFILNLSHLSEVQRDLLKVTFTTEMQEYQKLSQEEETLDELAKFRNAVKMYMQDLYRFLALHEYRNHFPRIFQWPEEGLGINLLNPYLGEHGIDRTIAHFHFEREHWKQAAHAFSNLTTTGAASHSIFEKAGYAFQQIHDYEKALDFYHKAELFDTNRSWLLKRMAFCYRKSGKSAEALRIYEDKWKENPSDLSLLVQIANIRLESKDYPGALSRYRQAELLDTDNARLLRPMAWCFLNTGEASQAIKALERIPEADLTYYDLMNIGHAWWMLGNIVQAAENYKKGLAVTANTQDDFLKGFMEDRNILHQAGIQETETAMMADLLYEYKISD